MYVLLTKWVKSQCENYRPISLLSNISKRVMYNRLEEFLKSSEIFYEYHSVSVSTTELIMH